MTWQLIRTNGTFPPGGYAFTDTITGKSYTDMHTTFDERVEEIRRDRLANHRLFVDNRFVDFSYIASQLSQQNCVRLKNNPVYCQNGFGVSTQSFATASQIPTANCRFCNAANVVPIYCPTCSGQRITGYRCGACGKDQ